MHHHKIFSLAFCCAIISALQHNNKKHVNTVSFLCTQHSKRSDCNRDRAAENGKINIMEDIFKLSHCCGNCELLCCCVFGVESKKLLPVNNVKVFIFIHSLTGFMFPRENRAKRLQWIWDPRKFTITQPQDIVHILTLTKAALRARSLTTAVASAFLIMFENAFHHVNWGCFAVKCRESFAVMKLLSKIKTRTELSKWEKFLCKESLWAL